jgi:hypothetical protein
MDSAAGFCSRRRFLESKPARMSMPATPSNPTPAGDDRNLVAVDPTTAVSFEDKLQLFWKKNRNAVFVLCLAVVLAIAAKEGWQYMGRQKETEIEKVYAAATTPEQLKAFAVSHADHTLGGIAHLRMADDAYKAGKSADAIAGYEKAIGSLKEGPLVARAQLGRALAKVQSGKTADGQAELKKMADDAKQLKAVRAEAAYHLTSLAVDAGDAAEAQKYVDQLMQLDVASPWTQRAMGIRATLPAQPAAGAPATKNEPGASQKKPETSQPVQVKIPGK